MAPAPLDDDLVLTVVGAEATRINGVTLYLSDGTEVFVVVTGCGTVAANVAQREQLVAALTETLHQLARPPLVPT